MLLPLRRMFERYEIEKADSDVAAFYSLLHAGEYIIKLTVCGLVAGLQDDRDRHRYNQMRALVHADGIGEWANSLDAILIGPGSQFILDGFRVVQREITQRHADGAWQYEAVKLLHSVLQDLGVEVERLSANAALRQWFHWFSLLRNKTRGHGAPLGAECAGVVSALEASIAYLRDNLTLFSWEWAYLHRNLSKKYRVTPLSNTALNFSYLKSNSNFTFPNGVYVFQNTPLRVELVVSDPDATDFLLPNGQFRGTEYEVLSYITNENRRVDGNVFLTPPSTLPSSETQGKPALDPQGNLFANLPEAPANYVQRPSLEERLKEALLHERHEIVTLNGPGGIGKTSLALSVLWELTSDPQLRFEAVVWFSARDIDLLESGPRPVRPHGLSIDDFANEFMRLIEPPERNMKGLKPVEYLASALTRAPLGPTIFVFDNFETVVSPAELFRWLDTYVRAPNKILITTRTRDFVGDFPIEVPGMTEQEAGELVDTVACRLGITELMTPEYLHKLYEESGGHPYVIKILLGKVAEEGQARSPSRLIADQERILQALFERTYSVLTPAAQRVFLLLSSWRSIVPALGVEAVVMRNAEERIDVRAAIDELKRLSLIEERTASEGEESFLSVPLAASSFGRRKLNTSVLKVSIETDLELLQTFGAARKEDVRSGVRP
jgi:NB-ARC domain